MCIKCFLEIGKIIAFLFFCLFSVFILASESTANEKKDQPINPSYSGVNSLSGINHNSPIKLIPAIGVDESTENFQQWRNLYQQKKVLLAKLIDNGEGKNTSTSPIYINGLIEQQAPYLLRHATNPVNWQTWSPDVFKQAKQEGKLIFLSIGYSSCHWCHVMEQQSFTDLSIAKLLAQHYIAVKVDRELLPHIDQHYKKQLQALTGSAGWPITAVLNAQAEPIFISSFLKKSKLTRLLTNTFPHWQKNTESANANAKRLATLAKGTNSAKDASYLSEQYSFEPSLQNKNNIDGKIALVINNRLSYLRKNTDPEYGGLTGKVKFPNEAALLLQINYLATNEDKALEKTVRLQLDNMLAYGLYDSINGGFFRYATDPKWQVPHYEKMAYNQALMLQVYSRAWQVFAEQRYLQVIQDLTAFIQQWFYQADYGFSSAIDAVYQGKEGGYYLWEKAQITQTLSPQEQHHIRLYQFQKNTVGIYFKENFSVTNQTIKEKLRNLNANQAKPTIDNKVITAWNGMMIVGLLEAYQVTQNSDALTMAKNALNAVLKHQFDQQKNILYRSALQGQYLPQPALLEDYSWLALSSIQLYKHTQSKQWLKQARHLVNIIYQNFPFQQGLPLSVSNINQTGPILFNSINFEDNEMYSGLAALQQTLYELTKHSEKERWHKRLNNIKLGLLSLYGDSNGVDFSISATMQKTRQPSLAIQYFANGHGRAYISTTKHCQEGWQQLHIDLQHGWHINSNQPFNTALIATKITLTALPSQAKELNKQPIDQVNKNMLQVQYPTAIITQLPFSKDKLSLYQGNLIIPFKLPTQIKDRAIIKVNLQACSDTICKLPETLSYVMNGC